MNAAAKEAVKTLIDTNSATLLTGLTAQGQARQIVHLTTSISTPATGYFFVAVHCAESPEHSLGGRNISKPPRAAEYDMIVHVEDYIVGATGEDELFEEQTASFDKFVDRIKALIADAVWIPDATSSPKFNLVRSPAATEDQVIVRSDAQQGRFDEAERYHSMLYAQLRFRMEDKCVDHTQLYA